MRRNSTMEKWGAFSGRVALGNIASILERAAMENFGGGCDVASAVTLFSD